MLTWFNPDRTGLSAPSGIVRAHEICTVMEAEELLAKVRQERDALLAGAAEEALAIVDNAHRRAEAVVAQAEQKASQLLEEASAQFDAEVERGQAEGERQAAAQWHSRHAEQIAGQAERLKATDQKLAELVALAVHRMVHAEPREALFQRSLETVQSLMQRTGTVTLRVSTDDLEHARAAVAALPSADQPNGFSIDVQADMELSPGSCIFSSEIGTLDASLDLQLAALRSALDRAVSQVLTDPGEDESLEQEQSLDMGEDDDEDDDLIEEDEQYEEEDEECHV